MLLYVLDWDILFEVTVLTGDVSGQKSPEACSGCLSGSR